MMFLLPAALLVFHWREEFVNLKPLQRAIVSLAAVGFGWQWIAAAAVAAVALAWPEVARSQGMIILPWLSVFFGPSLALAVLFVFARVRLWI
jgi:hypothetical protein